jgi:hypothetical protein
MTVFMLLRDHTAVASSPNVQEDDASRHGECSLERCDDLSYHEYSKAELPRVFGFDANSGGWEDDQ